MKHQGLALLGSTGSIGVSSLTVAAHLKIPVVALAAHSNATRLIQQARETKASLVAIYDASKYAEVKRALPGVVVMAGAEGVDAVASHPLADFVISAITGLAGLGPTLKAIEAKKTIGLANKETLVAGGSLVMKKAKEANVTILPIDSEHSAIFQCLQGQPKEKLRRIILTASGGPFRTASMETLRSATFKEALCHPTWKMGPKVTIDSATLMNKGLEVIEAAHLFDLPKEKIEVVVHPQSIIHSLVEFQDGSLLAQLGEPTMLVPIQYALTHPARQPGLLQPFDLVKQGTLTFFSPDLEKFPSLRLAYEALNCGKSLPCFMNGANEVLVERFLKGEFSFFEIAKKLETLMLGHLPRPAETLSDLLAVDKEARLLAQETKVCIS